MNHRLRRQLRVVLVLLAASVLLGSPSTPPTTARQPSAGCTLAPEAPGSQDRVLAGPAGELSLEQKHAAFDNVLLNRFAFDDYDCPVAVTQSQNTTFAPVLLKSVAGIESDWTQYEQSYAPNLILFRHRTLPLLPDVNVQTIAFEYDLPFSAQVTLTLVLQNGSEQPLCTQAGEAGWNQLYCRAQVRLQNGDAYRIRAERGDPEQPDGYYLGQYLQLFSFADQPLQAQNLRYAVHLPLVQNTSQPVALFNRTFSLTDPRAGWKPDYWDVQALVSRDQDIGLPDVSDVVVPSNDRQGWQLLEAPGGVVDMRQRIALEPGNYLLRVRLDVQGRDAASVLTIRTRPAAPGPQPWTLVATSAAEASGPQSNDYRIQLDGPVTISLLAAFGRQDGQSAFTLRSVELFR